MLGPIPDGGHDSPPRCAAHGGLSAHHAARARSVARRGFPWNRLMLLTCGSRRRKDEAESPGVNLAATVSSPAVPWESFLDEVSLA